MITRENAILNSRILHDNEEWTVAIPLSKEAAIYWGQGTDWSISRSKSNNFEEQTKVSPQIVMIFHDVKRKWLFRVTSDSVYLIDHNGHHLDEHDTDLLWHLVGDLLISALTINFDVIDLIAEHRRDERCASAMTELGITPKAPKAKFSTYASCLVEVKRKPHKIKKVPFSLLNDEICLVAVSANGHFLEDIPVPCRTAEVCKTAVKTTAFAFNYVPPAMRDEELCALACTSDSDFLAKLPDQILHSTSFLERVAAEQPMLLEHLSHTPETKELITEQLCVIAASNSRGYKRLKFVPDRFLTPKVCLAAVSSYGGNLSHVPHELKTLELCLAAVQNSGYSLQFVPEEHRTRELCLEAVKQAGSAVLYVPARRQLDERLWLAAVTNDGQMLVHVPEHIRTDTIYAAAVHSDGTMLRLVPSHLMAELVPVALEQSPRSLRHVPSDMKTKEMCESAVKRDSGALGDVPAEFIDDEMCWTALRRDGMAIMHIPYDKQSIEMSKYSYGQVHNYLSFINPKHHDILLGKAVLKPWHDNPAYAGLVGE